ncbi:HNH endonuclease [Streptomyces phage RosaAsantewaa]|nr:HNH endonuclease [Streptomyces phage RosaAsantewaa]
MIRSYREVRRLETLEERFHYLKLRGKVGEATFGFDRYLNQAFYRSTEWRHIRDQVIVRDNGCDLGVEGFDIHQGIYIHHLNPMTVAQIEAGDPAILDLDNLIAVSHRTHNAIHYGDESLLPRPLVERRPGDTNLW